MYSTFNKLCCKILALVVVAALLLPSFTGHASFELVGTDDSGGGNSPLDGLSDDSPSPFSSRSGGNLIIGDSGSSNSDIELSITLGSSRVGVLGNAVRLALENRGLVPDDAYGLVTSLRVDGGALDFSDFSFLESSLSNIHTLDLGGSDCYGTVFYSGNSEYGILPVQSYTNANQKLKKIILPMGLRKIGKKAFNGCSGIEELVVNSYCLEDITNGGYTMFEEAASIAKITVVFMGANLDDLTYTDWFKSVKALDSNVMAPDFSLGNVEACLSNGSESKVVTSGFDGHTLVVTEKDMAGGESFSTAARNILNSFGGFSYLSGRITDVVVRNVEADAAFLGRNFPNLKAVDLLAATNQRIGSKPFYQSRIESILLPSGLVEIEASAFEGCAKLNSVAIPDSVRVIGGNAFRSSGLSGTLLLPEGINTIGNYAFADCAITRVENVGGTVGAGAFMQCAVLSVAVVQPGTAFGSGALEGTQIKSDPAGSILAIDDASATGAQWMELAGLALTESSLAATRQEVVGVVGSIGRYKNVGGTLVPVEMGAFDGKLVIDTANMPSGRGFGEAVETALLPYGSLDMALDAVTELTVENVAADYAYISARFPHLERLYLQQASNETVGGLSSLMALEEVGLPGGKLSIQADAFRDCARLSTVSLPKSANLLAADPSAFSGTLFSGAPDTCRLIIEADSAVDYRFALEAASLMVGQPTVKLYSNVNGTLTRLLPDTLALRVSAADVARHGSARQALEAQLAGYADGGDGSALRGKVRSVVFSGVTVDGAACASLRDFSGIEEIKLEDGSGFLDNLIPAGAFEGLSGLTFAIPGGVVEIGANAFKGTLSQNTLALPISVRVVGSGAFDGWDTLTAARLPSGLTCGGKITDALLESITIDFTGGDTAFALLGYRDVIASAGYAALPHSPDAVLYAAKGAAEKAVAPTASNPPALAVDGSDEVAGVYPSGTHTIAVRREYDDETIEYKQESGLLGFLTAVWEPLEGDSLSLVVSNRSKVTVTFRASNPYFPGYSAERAVTLKADDAICSDAIPMPDVLVDGAAPGKVYASGTHVVTAETDVSEGFVQYMVKEGGSTLGGSDGMTLGGSGGWLTLGASGQSFSLADGEDITYLFRAGTAISPSLSSPVAEVTIRADDAVHNGVIAAPSVMLDGLPQILPLYRSGSHAFTASTTSQGGIVQYKEKGALFSPWKDMGGGRAQIDWSDGIQKTYVFRAGSTLNEMAFSSEVEITVRVDDDMLLNPVNPPEVSIDGAELARLYLSGSHIFSAATKYPEEWVEYRLRDEAQWRPLDQSGAPFTVPDSAETTYLFRCGNGLKPDSYSAEVTVLVKTEDMIFNGETPAPGISIDGAVPQKLYGLGGHTLQAETPVEEGFVEYREDNLFGVWKKMDALGQAVAWERDNVEMAYRFRVGSALKDGVYGAEAVVTFRVFEEMFSSPVNAPEITIDSAGLVRLYLSGGHIFSAATKYPEEWVEYRLQGATGWNALDKGATPFAVPDNAETSYVFRCGNDLKPGEASEEVTVLVKTNDAIFTGNTPAPTVMIDGADPQKLYGLGTHRLWADTRVEEGFVEYREGSLLAGSWKKLDPAGCDVGWDRDNVDMTYRFRVGSTLKEGVYGVETAVTFRVFEEMFSNPVNAPSITIDKGGLVRLYLSGPHAFGAATKYPEEWVEYRLQGAAAWNALDKGATPFAVPDNAETSYVFRCGNDLKPGQQSSEVTVLVKTNDEIYTGNAPAPEVTINGEAPLPLYGWDTYHFAAATRTEEGFVEYRESGFFPGGWKVLGQEGEDITWGKDRESKSYRFRVGSALKPGTYGHEREVSFRIFEEMFRNPVTVPAVSIDAREGIDTFYASGSHGLGVRRKYPEEWVEYRTGDSGEWKRFDVNGQTADYSDLTTTAYVFRAGNDLKPRQHSGETRISLRADDTLFGYNEIIKRIGAELTTDDAVWAARFAHPMKEYAASIEGVVDLYDDVIGSEKLSGDLPQENVEAVRGLASRVCGIFSAKVGLTQLTADESQRQNLEELYNTAQKTAHLPYSRAEDRDRIAALYNSLQKVGEFEAVVQEELAQKEEFAAEDSGMVLGAAETYLRLEGTEQSAVIPERYDAMNEAVAQVFDKAWYNDVKGLDRNANQSSSDDVLISDWEELLRLKACKDFNLLRGTALPYVPEPGSTVDGKITFIDGDLERSIATADRLKALKQEIEELPDPDKIRPR